MSGVDGDAAGSVSSGGATGTDTTASATKKTRAAQRIELQNLYDQMDKYGLIILFYVLIMLSSLFVSV